MSSSDVKEKTLFTDEEKVQILGKIQKDLPDKWVVQFSNKHTNRVYFFNKANGTRSWQHPGLTSISTDKSKEKERLHRKRRSDETNPEGREAKMKVETVEPMTEILRLTKRKSGRKEESTVRAETSEKQIQSPSKRKKKKRRNKTSKAQNLPGVSGASKPMAVPSLSATEGASVHSTNLIAQSQDTPVLTGVRVKQSLMARCTSPQDIEMTELVEFSSGQTAPAQQTKEVHISAMERTLPSLPAAGKSCFIIVDTNILLAQEALDCIQKVLDRKEGKSTSLTKFVYIIPWVVLQELDHLKKTKKKARDAISFLNAQFRANHSLIRGQSIFEAASIVDGLTIENNDDRILQCCISMQNSSQDAVSLLLTRDKNLMNKALANKIKCFENVMSVWKFLGNKNLETTNDALSVPNAAKHRSGGKLEEENGNALEGRLKSRTLDSQELRDVHSKSCTHLLSALSFILEKEMKDAFSDLWLDIVLKKPPWSLKDLLLCIRKHWLAVFKQLGVDRLAQVHVTELLKSCGDIRPDDQGFVKTWLLSARALVVAINEKGRYGEPVKSDLVELRNLQQRLFSTSDQQESVASSPTDLPPIEMTVLTTESDDFWTALDKVWTSIISHCGMIFRSLDFAPSRLASAPELGEALSATFENIPPPPLAAHAVPFVADLVQSVEASLQRLLDSPATDQNCEAVFMDLLQTLWAAIQAFRIDCDVRPLIHSREEICAGILSSAPVTQRLKTGLQQLEVVRSFLGECLATLIAK